MPPRCLVCINNRKKGAAEEEGGVGEDSQKLGGISKSRARKSVRVSARAIRADILRVPLTPFDARKGTGNPGMAAVAVRF